MADLTGRMNELPGQLREFETGGSVISGPGRKDCLENSLFNNTRESYMKSVMLCLALGALLPTGFLAAQAKKTDPVTIEVMNPRSDLAPPPVFAPTARVKELAGKKVGIYWLGKAGGDNFFDAFEKVLKEKYPTVTTIRYKGTPEIGEKVAAQVAKEVDTLVYGVGD